MLKSNILAVYHRSSLVAKTEGSVWYENANRIARSLGEAHGYTTEKVAFVIAALSPRLRWSKNVEAASEVMGGAVACKGVFKASVDKARKMLDTQWLLEQRELLGKGLKTQNFATLIMEPDHEHAVCVDTHAFNVAFNKIHSEKELRKLFSSEESYRDVAQAYREAAAIVGILPSQMQAITWLTWRTEHAKIASRMDALITL